MARFNTQPITGSVTAGSTLAALTQNAFIQLTGTAPYTVTLPSPVLFPGFNQTFYNATSGTVTLTTPANVFTGAGGSGTATVTVPTTSTINLVSDGVNYVVIGEDGTSLIATTGSFSGNVTINGAGATLSVTPQTVTIAPGGTSTIDNVNIGVTTRGSGAFNTLAANAAVTFTAGTASSTTGTGTLVVTGGVGVSGNINSGGTVSAVALSGPLTGTLQTAAQPNITSVGNLTATGLTVDTDTLAVDITNNRVGISTASPTAKLHITGSTKVGGIFVESSSTSASSPSIEVIGKRSDGNASSAFAGKILLGGNRTDAAVAANKRLGAVAFGGNHTDGLLTNLLYTASVSGIAEGTFANANTMPTGLAFFTGAVGTTSESTTVTMGTERMRIDNTGRVGIGTTLPTSRLHVSFAGAVNTNTFNVSTTSSTNPPTTLVGANLVLDDAGTTYTKSATSISGAGILFEAANSINNHGSIQFLSAPDTNTASASPLERMRIDSAGNVGIGASTPAYKLDVAGSIGADNLRITAVNSSVAVTATKVFVYDTRKDSDGGAWRKRTQNTSWYNETLNTGTRGARREFPAVAVIVAFTGKVQIYDADDPALPFWIEFNNANLLQDNTTSVCMMNGLLVWGNKHSNSAYAQNNLVTCDFISETAKRFSHAGDAYGGTNTDGIVNRNTWDNQASWSGPNPYTLSNYYINDVAITVLPNAPIDVITSLPIPTIAIATNAGINVIHNNGIVNSINATDAVEYNYWRSVEFTKDYKLIINSTYLGVSNNIIHVCDIPFNNFSGAVVNQRITALNGRYYHSDSMTPNLKPGIDLARIASTGINALAIGGTGAVGITLVAEAPETVVGVNSSAMVAYVLPTFNTGWMVGDIKGAWLSDSTAETVTGTELITNGTFTSNTTGWTANTTSGTGHTFTATGGVMSVARAVGKGVGFGEPYQVLTVEANKQYVVLVDVGATQMSLSIASALSGGTAFFGANLPVGRNVISFTPTVTTVYLLFICDNAGTTSTVDNVSVRKAELDRSVNNKGLQVFGSIVKTPVATSADLVQYSGFSTANYLQNPYNSGLDFGTGDFCYMGWFKSNTATGGNQPLFWRGQTDTNAYAMIEPYIRADGRVDVLTRNRAEAFLYFTSTTNILTQTWRFWCMVRRHGVMSWYVDGKLDGSAVNTQDVTPLATRGIFEIGSDVSKVKALPGTVALYRASGTPPSDVQIDKIYNDEKKLFQDNAKAVLYGASGVITAVAFDDVTNLLHVGTSSGRSVFNGLRRVDNTATAVSASISAANGLVAEQ